MFDVRVTNIRHLDRSDAVEKMLAADPSKEQGMIMFYGDSGFTNWDPSCRGIRSMEDDLRAKDGSRAVLNHGFGTSTAEELLYYYDRLVKPWNPRALVMHVFSNDLTAGYSANEMMFLMARLMEYARKDIPGIRMYLCNVRPLIRPLNAGGKNQRDDYNRMIQTYCEDHPDTIMVRHEDCPGLFEDGHAGDRDYPRAELFLEDNVHLNQKGYDVYRDFFLKVLDDLL